MTRRTLLALALLFIACVARGACPESGGIGGTGVTSDGGIGGTGIRPQSDLGIIGVVTAFGSICVNNVEIDYDAATPIASGGMAATAKSLAIGQVVAVRAIGDAQRARAQRIEILDGPLGPVEAFDPASSVAQIAGQRVHVGAGTVFGADMTREALAQRPAVRVSGLWRADGSLQATLIERVHGDVAARTGARDWPQPGGSLLIVEGYVRDAQRDRLNVGGLELERRPGAQAELRRDDLVRAVVRMDGGRPMVERTQLLRDERPGRGERNESSERGERGEGSRGGDRVDRSGSGRPERLERPERGGSERPERPERIDRSGRR